MSFITNQKQDITVEKQCDSSQRETNTLPSKTVKTAKKVTSVEPAENFIENLSILTGDYLLLKDLLDSKDNDNDNVIVLSGVQTLIINPPQKTKSFYEKTQQEQLIPEDKKEFFLDENNRICFYNKDTIQYRMVGNEKYPILPQLEKQTIECKSITFKIGKSNEYLTYGQLKKKLEFLFGKKASYVEKISFLEEETYDFKRIPLTYKQILNFSCSGRVKYNVNEKYYYLDSVTV